MADWPIAFTGRLTRLDLTADWPIGASRLEPIDCRVTSKVNPATAWVPGEESGMDAAAAVDSSSL